MCASPVGNVFVKDFVEFVVTGKKVTGCVHDFLCFEEKVGVLVNTEVLEQYPNDCSSWIISGLQCIPVNAILCVLPEASTWAMHIYQLNQIPENTTTSLTQFNDGVSVCVYEIVYVFVLNLCF